MNYYLGNLSIITNYGNGTFLIDIYHPAVYVPGTTTTGSTGGTTYTPGYWTSPYHEQKTMTAQELNLINFPPSGSTGHYYATFTKNQISYEAVGNQSGLQGYADQGYVLTSIKVDDSTVPYNIRQSSSVTSSTSTAVTLRTLTGVTRTFYLSSWDPSLVGSGITVLSVTPDSRTPTDTNNDVANWVLANAQPQGNTTTVVQAQYRAPNGQTKTFYVGLSDYNNWVLVNPSLQQYYVTAITVPNQPLSAVANSGVDITNFINNNQTSTGTGSGNGTSFESLYPKQTQQLIDLGNVETQIWSKVSDIDKFTQAQAALSFEDKYPKQTQQLIKIGQDDVFFGSKLSDHDAKLADHDSKLISLGNAISDSSKGIDAIWAKEAAQDAKFAKYDNTDLPKIYQQLTDLGQATGSTGKLQTKDYIELGLAGAALVFGIMAVARR